jgi:DNA polymerase-3 subunit gamma/tau
MAQGGPTAALAEDQALARYPTFAHVLELIRANRDVKLLVDVEGGVRLSSYRPGRIEFTPAETAPADLAQRLGGALSRWTGNRWAVSVVNDCTAATILEARDSERLDREAAASAHPLVKATLEAFPGARISAIRTEDDLVRDAGEEALPEVEDEWDPFEEG